MTTKNNKYGFTLVEMLVVIAIITILLAVSSSAVNGARKSARRHRSRDLCRQLVVAWNTYYTNERSFPKELDEKAYEATAENIGKYLNTQYIGDKVAERIVYFETSDEECKRTKKSSEGDSFSGTGVLDDWKNVIYFKLDIDGDNKIKAEHDDDLELTATAYAYSTAGSDKKSKYVSSW